MADEYDDCLNRVGVQGDGSCPELSQHIHCRNCPVFETRGRSLLDREPPAAYLQEQTDLLAQAKASSPWVEHVANVFRIGPEWLALPARLFVEIVSVRPIRRVPHRSNEILLGLTSVRGEIHLCFSLAHLIGVETGGDLSAPVTTHSIPRFLVVRWKRATWVFPADEVYGLHRYRQEDIQPIPATVAKALPKFTAGLLPFAEKQAGLFDEELLFQALERGIA